MLLKAAIIIDWIRIFVPGHTRNRFFWCGWALIGLNTGFYVVGILTENLACVPFQYTWDKTIPGGHCRIGGAIKVATTAIDFVSDLAVTILPQQVIWRLQMSTKKKIGVSVLFGIGLLYVNAVPPPPKPQHLLRILKGIYLPGSSYMAIGVLLFVETTH